MWWVGDWYLFGERIYGERAAQAVGDETGYSARTVQQAAWVAGRFPASSRLENVDFGTHMALAGIEDTEKRYALLGQAGEERWDPPAGARGGQGAQGRRCRGLPRPGGSHSRDRAPRHGVVS